jgi:UDP-N-acetylglucosamine 1-carboxyvinyltransferase
MGVRYNVEKGLLKIHGGDKFYGARVRALDLRAGIALLLAGLTAEGDTIIEDAWQIERGYENLLQKIKELGGS